MRHVCRGGLRHRRGNGCSTGGRRYSSGSRRGSRCVCLTAVDLRQPGEPATIHNNARPANSVTWINSRERRPRAGDDVGEDAHRGRGDERRGERQQAERPMRLPRGIGEADRERRTECAEVSWRGGGWFPTLRPSSSAGRLCASMTTATQASAGRNQPPRPRRAGRARAVTEATRLGTGSAGRMRTIRSMRSMSEA